MIPFSDGCMHEFGKKNNFKQFRLSTQHAALVALYDTVFYSHQIILLYNMLPLGKVKLKPLTSDKIEM